MKRKNIVSLSLIPLIALGTLTACNDSDNEQEQTNNEQSSESSENLNFEEGYDDENWEEGVQPGTEME